MRHFGTFLIFIVSIILWFSSSLVNAQDRYVCFVHGIEDSSGLDSNYPTTIIGLWNSFNVYKPDNGDVIHIQNGYTYYVKDGSTSKKSRLAIIRGTTNGFVTWIGDDKCTAGSHGGVDGSAHPIIMGTQDYSDQADWTQYNDGSTNFDIWYTDVESEDFNVTTNYPTKNWEPNTVFFKSAFNQTQPVTTWGRRQASITDADTIGEFRMEQNIVTPNSYRLYIYAASNPASYYNGVFIPQIAAGAWLVGDDDQVKIKHIEFQFFPTGITISNTAFDSFIDDCRFQWMGIGPNEGALQGWPANGDAINMQGQGTEGSGADSVRIINNFIRECGGHGIYINSQTITSVVQNVLVENNEIWNCYHTGIDLQNFGSAEDMNDIVIRNNMVHTAVDTIINWNTRAPICVGIQLDGGEDMNGVEFNIDRTEIYNNIIVSNSHGINILNYVNGPCHIYENTVDKKDANTGTTHYAAFFLLDIKQDTAGVVIVKNNIFQTTNSENWQIKIQNGSKMESKIIDNNLYWNNLPNAIDEFRGRYLGTTFTTLTDWQDTTGVDSLSKNGNTNFTNDDIYTLLLSSSAIDIGVDLPDRYNIDFIGTFRPQDSLGHGGSWDAGAYEYKYLVTGLSSDNSFLPKEFALDVYPNPFNPTAKIKVSLEKKSDIKIIVYDILGSVVTILADDSFDAGYYIFNFNGSNLSSGIYILTVERRTNFITKKIVLIK